eukprot:4867531-Amphidinium_carterae.1
MMTYEALSAHLYRSACHAALVAILEGFWYEFDLDPVDRDATPAYPPQLARFLASGLATFLPDQLPHSGGTISISVERGLLAIFR